MGLAQAEPGTALQLRALALVARRQMGMSLEWTPTWTPSWPWPCVCPCKRSARARRPLPPLLTLLRQQKPRVRLSKARVILCSGALEPKSTQASDVGFNPLFLLLVTWHGTALSVLHAGFCASLRQCQWDALLE